METLESLKIVKSTTVVDPSVTTVMTMTHPGMPDWLSGVFFFRRESMWIQRTIVDLARSLFHGPFVLLFFFTNPPGRCSP